MHSRYVGEFHSGLKDGKGVMLYRSGETREGNWDEDKLNGMYEYFGVYFLWSLLFRVIFRKEDGTVKEEFWEDKNHQEEKLVKMGNMDNFHSLLGEVGYLENKNKLIIIYSR